MTEPLGPGETGTVYMKLGQADFEYKGDREKTRKNRIGEFFTVGDVGHLNEEGYLFLSDRKIDMIIAGGVNIYPAEIENVLLGHPKVGDVAVFGIPDTDLGEAIKAVIEPADHATLDSANRFDLTASADRFAATATKILLADREARLAAERAREALLAPAPTASVVNL